MMMTRIVAKILSKIIATTPYTSSSFCSAKKLGNIVMQVSAKSTINIGRNLGSKTHRTAKK